MSDDLKRLEAATAGSRDLDAMIHYSATNGVGCGYAGDAPHYTTSIDAALTLVPDGCWRNMDLLWTTGLKGEPCVIADLRWVRSKARAATPALAICIAALEAKRLTDTGEKP